MSTQLALMVGFMGGLLLAAVLFLSTLMRYISRDTDSFMKWLDQKEGK